MGVVWVSSAGVASTSIKRWDHQFGHGFDLHVTVLELPFAVGTYTVMGTEMASRPRTQPSGTLADIGRRHRQSRARRCPTPWIGAGDPASSASSARTFATARVSVIPWCECVPPNATRNYQPNHGDLIFPPADARTALSQTHTRPCGNPRSRRPKLPSFPILP